MNLSSDPINTLENLISKNKTKNISIYLIVVLAITTFIALLPVINVDISSQSRGVIRSQTDNVPLSTLVSGKITHINLKNNLFVNKGDTLLIVAKDNLEVEKQLTDTLTNTNQYLLDDLNSILSKKMLSLKTSTIREEYFRFSTQKAELQSKVELAQINFNRYKSLFDKGVIAKAEFEKYQFELQFTQQALNSFVKQQIANWENRKNEIEVQLQNYQGTKNKIGVEEKNYMLIAPITGTIENFTGLQSGSFINASQLIANVSPTDKLIVESIRFRQMTLAS